MSLLVLSATNVDEVITKFRADELVDLMAKVFVTLHASPHQDGSSAQNDSSDVCIPHRSTIASTNHRVLFMPARLSNIGTAIKIVSVPTAAAPVDVKSRGLPGSTMVIDEHAGAVVAVVNARKLTALRNAASQLSTHAVLRTD